mmetsp:Transcript_4980/g.7554  ORF Transcript_4980/g.7554 Transcript_4980/m.7554 type:complete len:232 (-) Transcript_4980:186-881(-)|eukprot:CAMPEP_0113942742 /NCGR_PEP_ID=MMETSP1339-20121228/8912_1 /TAXON_ID=94617 /ORGANISM="Fibrocapsa japonica" /LENGTH=231 /DNA_ID=CAMNT_0000947317 /DNA_START=94 /DNA_END=789 /DNA_ORIENTATION=+ /assembly_acc=CAM_ASM_000762
MALQRALSASRPACSALGARLISSTSSKSSKYSLPDLKYDYGALEPFISGEIMELHHSKHHATYVNNFNSLTEQLAEAEAAGDASKIITLGQALKFNGGGHINHSIFWENLAPVGQGGGELPDGKLKAMIEAQYGSLDNLQAKMSAITVGVQGSGWGWLGYDKSTCTLRLAACPNQDPLEATTGMVPLLGIDVWEHAYYLQYKNVRPDYVKQIWNVVNWSDVAQRYEEASK